MRAKSLALFHKPTQPGGGIDPRQPQPQPLQQTFSTGIVLRDFKLVVNHVRQNEGCSFISHERAKPCTSRMCSSKRDT
ncbi:unnamed protein product [Lactuca virosa]|uniref:Uncharacterized protein n=1 Tax=Lactuca virosa TaxID=75947 RepID=A0AAU9PP04_9ASTR|nr:unnamed protein product [Lactuca virosa]